MGVYSCVCCNSLTVRISLFASERNHSPPPIEAGLRKKEGGKFISSCYLQNTEYSKFRSSVFKISNKVISMMSPSLHFLVLLSLLEMLSNPLILRVEIKCPPLNQPLSSTLLQTTREESKQSWIWVSKVKIRASVERGEMQRRATTIG